MATESGTATSAADLYAKLTAFLTTNAALVAAGQAWVNVWNTGTDPTDRVLRGPGLSNQDQVYVGMRLRQNVVADSYWIEAAGMTGILPVSTHYNEHINGTPANVRMFLDSGSMEYWFSANGRRFMVTVKISTVYETMYAGLFMPYANPLSYAYPFFIGASAGQSNKANGHGAESWRDEDLNHTHFFAPHYEPYPGYNVYHMEASAWLIDPAGQWLRVSSNTAITANTSVTSYMHPGRTDGDYFTANEEDISYYQADFVMNRMMAGYGGIRALVPLTLIAVSPSDQTYGVLDGAFRCQGVANQAENVITNGGVNHLVVQNVYRTGFEDFWAMALE